MSITFAPEYSETDIVTYNVLCEDGSLIATCLTYGDAKMAAETHGLTCEYSRCGDYGAEIDTINNVPELTVSNSNGFYLLELLGLTPSYVGDLPSPFEYGEMSGSCSADDFLGRILIAQGLNGPDVGVPLHQLPNRGGAPVYDCGRREGYADEMLRWLADLARWARAAARPVVWS